MTAVRLIHKCIPEAILSIPSVKKGSKDTKSDDLDFGSGILAGGWSELEEFKSEKIKFDYWIKNAFDRFHIYHDYADTIKIDKVYSQIVSGVNYWISFQLLPTGESYWLQVYEPLVSDSDSPNVGKIMSLIQC